MPTRTMDLSKFRKNITKSLDNVSFGFHPPADWIDTGNYCLNKLISGDFFRGVPLGKVTMFAGESGAGKSYICSGNLARNAQKQGCLVVLLDSEDALEEDWLRALGVDTGEDALMRMNVTMVDDVGRTLADFVKGYKELHEGLDPKTQIGEFQKVLIVIDSLGMLLTPTDKEQYERGDMKGDLGRKAKALTSMIRNTVTSIASLPIGIVMTNHIYRSQDQYAPEDKISGGEGIVFASSIVVQIDKRKLKAKDAAEAARDGRTDKEQVGIQAVAKIQKTRYSRPFERVHIDIPFTTGMDPFSGIFEFLSVKGFIKRKGSYYHFTDASGEKVQKYRKDITHDDFLHLMKVYDDDVASAALLEDADGSTAPDEAPAEAAAPTSKQAEQVVQAAIRSNPNAAKAPKSKKTKGDS